MRIRIDFDLSSSIALYSLANHSKGRQGLVGAFVLFSASDWSSMFLNLENVAETQLEPARQTSNVLGLPKLFSFSANLVDQYLEKQSPSHWYVVG